MIIEAKGLKKIYNHVPVVDDVDLLVPEGEVFGFLGPNGSGKTTVMRMLLGLVKTDGGDIKILGKSLEKNRLSILKEVGALIETPAYYGHLNAIDNLKIAATLRQIEDNSQIEKTLDRVGLTSSKHKKVKSFSLGMKQRLGIAMALLHQPKLLLLDEPTNGLDPEGIQEMRELIRDLPKKEGVTVFVSSHLLGEIDQVASQVGVIYHGSLLYQGQKNDLLASHGGTTVSVHTPEKDKVEQLLVMEGFHIQKSIRHKEDEIMITGPHVTKEVIVMLLQREGIQNYYVQEHHRTLEDAYMALIGGKGVAV
ncbi:ATP-binding cassette domain-containing protein [Halalkalibacterium halodurans]|uniref:ATP-binding cassette domain-containing protein n=1 Tax=Halalkalibacterium halodurans TaxID=86665 RepID=UPI0010689106|nr:ATP-binding cassette domain-containing protein [Halalkalibacterium halodurans]MDY7220949.1 ATP-binding cassette domain-containing protein [Halalkalibacterium halodurans]MDY7240188.1 ATP-binding cassette domain-containing protein [Halalkalibacterium halodurans]MED3646518.1 ATP-binding cassette domain-containing protein [Halalkalibacterium halodurans]TES51799.1 ATP-binding cassette domain-containing protein [Halalkalibacterium halodurans]